MGQTIEAAEAPTHQRAARAIIAAHGFSSFCWGMIFPYTGIYLADKAGIGTQGVALYYAVSGLANLAVALTLAAGVVHPPRVPLGVAGNLLSVTGFLLVPVAGSLPMLAVAAAACGAGLGCFLAASIPIINSLVPDDERRHIFALRYQVLNGTLAGGSLVAGLLVTALSRDVIPYLIVVHAMGWVPVALVLTRSRRAAEAGEEALASGEPGDGLSVLLLVKVALAVSLFQLGAYAFGFSQFEATAPLVADRLLGTRLGWISVMVTVNVVVIVVAQRWVTRRLAPFSEVMGLRVAIGLWTASFVTAGITAFGPPGVQFAGLLVYAAVFALGECAYSCSFHPWLIGQVPEGDLTRANALSNSMMGIGLLLGPSIGVLLVGTGSAALVWLPLAAACMTVGVATLHSRRGRQVALG